MNNKLIYDIEELRKIKTKICTLNAKRQKERIEKISPYSKDIASYIRRYDELNLYCSLQLRESFLTRPSLVADIDPELWISSENATNLELMSKGNAPYLFNAPDGKIELHHIGQDYNSPFAELTREEHSIYNSILHLFDEASWRNDPDAERIFSAERTKYWILRARGENIICDLPNIEHDTYFAEPCEEYLAELRELCEEIYRQSNAKDLAYLSDLAKSYALMNDMGIYSMREFLNNKRNEQDKLIFCSACGKANNVLYGTYISRGERVQRYKCKQCGTVFTETTKTLLAGSSFSFSDWLKFIDCLYNGFTLRQIAKACGISEKTAHENRLKLFYALKILNDKVKLNGHIAIDETFLPVSFKGNHTKQESFIMPRNPNERGFENHNKGISSNHVCVVCAIDDTGNSIADVCGTGKPSAAKLNYVLIDHLGDDVACLYSDKSSAIKAFAQSCGYEIKQDKLLVKNGKYAKNIKITHNTFLINRYIQKVSNYHSKLKQFLRRFSGTSTKYLAGYLYLFAWKERNKDRTQEDIYKELLQTMAEPIVKNLLNGNCLPDALTINSTYRQKKLSPSERDLSIGKKYANGRSLSNIGAEYNMTKQNVHRIINHLKEAGIDCSPSFANRTKETPKTNSHKYINKKVVETLDRDYQIYNEKLSWKGSAVEFRQKTAKKYGISEQRVSNIVALIKRFLRLKEEIYIYEDISFKTLGEVYRAVYSDYLELLQLEPGTTPNTHFKKLAEKYGYRPANIYRIVKNMSEENTTEYLSTTKRLTKTETFNRDKAIFIDYLRWIGSRGEFCRHAAIKYNLSFNYVDTILKYCLYADLKRLDMV